MEKKTGRKNKHLTGIIPAFLAVAFVVAVWFFQGNPLKGLEGTLGSNRETPDNPGFEIHFVDVGQGDCAVVTCSGASMLIDAGENGKEDSVFRALDSLGVKKPDCIVATHPHTDHIGGMPEVIEEYGTDNFIMPAVPDYLIPEFATYHDMNSALEKTKTKVTEVTGIYGFGLGEAQVTVIPSACDNPESLNNISLVIRITYGETSFLFCSDAEREEEDSLIENGVDLDCDLMKVGHHGSYHSSSDEFLEKVTPEICIISVGEYNDYGHPSEETLERLSRYTDKIYRTDICGDITAVSDGKKTEIFF